MLASFHSKRVSNVAIMSLKMLKLTFDRKSCIYTASKAISLMIKPLTHGINFKDQNSIGTFNR